MGMIGLAAIQAEALPLVDVGEAQVRGTACRLQGNELGAITLEEGIMRIPTAIALKKTTEEASLKRGSCQFTIPMKVADGYKLLLTDLRAFGRMNLSRETSNKLSLEIFQAGQQGTKILAEDQADSESRLRKAYDVGVEGVVLETECGAALNLRGNANIILSGGTARSTASLDFVAAKAEIVSCGE